MSAVGFVVGGSITMSWCFEDEHSEQADQVLSRLATAGTEACAPPIWQLEVANVLVVAERRRRITSAQAGRFLKLLRELPITVVDTDPQRAFAEVLALARTHQLSVYDACYLDLAISLGLPLATADRALKRAAESCGVETI